MNATRKQLDGSATLTMVLLCAVWGLHQVAIKAAAPDMAPILQIALRSGISAVLVALLIAGSSIRLGRDATLAPGLLLALLFAAEFFFVAEGLRFTSASHMSVFLYTAPIFTALALQWRLPSERLRRHQWLGIAVAFSGIVVAFAGNTLQEGLDLRMLWGDLLGVGAGATWGACTVLVRCSRLSETEPAKVLLYQLVGAFFLLLLYAVISGQAENFTMSGIVWASLLFQGVVVTFASYLVWFVLLRRYLASRLSVLSFLSPLFGVSFGVLLLDEPITLAFGLGAALVLGGIALVSSEMKK